MACQVELRTRCWVLAETAPGPDSIVDCFVMLVNKYNGVHGKKMNFEVTMYLGWNLGNAVTASLTVGK